jgi:hypothetical protein
MSGMRGRSTVHRVPHRLPACDDPSSSLTEEAVATAAISTESFGELIGGAVGGVLINGAHLEASRFVGAFLFFAVALGFAAVSATRSATRAA